MTLIDHQKDEHGQPVLPDMLEQMFGMQEHYMLRLKEKGLIGVHHDAPPEWPLDVTERSSQLELKDLAFNSMSELFEAVQLLKNAKKHRQTDIREFDREKFLIECVDAYKYFLEILIFMGVTPAEFFQAYCKKDLILHKRIDEGY